MTPRFPVNMSFRNAPRRRLATATLAAMCGLAAGCASPHAPVEPVRVEFLFAGTTINAVPIGSGRLLTVADGVPGDRENVATVTMANGWRSTGPVRVVDRGVPAGVPTGQSGPERVDARNQLGRDTLDSDWSILWFELAPEPTSVLAAVEPVVGDQVTIRGIGQGVLRHPTSIQGVVVQVLPVGAGPPRSFLVNPTGGSPMSPGMSGSPVFVERQIGEHPVLLLAGILQARAESDGALDGLLRCIVVPSAVLPGVGLPTASPAR